MRFDFTKDEIKQIKEKIYLSPRQELILEYRLSDYSIIEIASRIPCSESTVNREIKKIKRKIMKVI